MRSRPDAAPSTCCAARSRTRRRGPGGSSRPGRRCSRHAAGLPTPVNRRRGRPEGSRPTPGVRERLSGAPVTDPAGYDGLAEFYARYWGPRYHDAADHVLDRLAYAIASSERARARPVLRNGAPVRAPGRTRVRRPRRRRLDRHAAPGACARAWGGVLVQRCRGARLRTSVRCRAVHVRQPEPRARSRRARRRLRRRAACTPAGRPLRLRCEHDRRVHARMGQVLCPGRARCRPHHPRRLRSSAPPRAHRPDTLLVSTVAGTGATCRCGSGRGIRARRPQRSSAPASSASPSTTPPRSACTATSPPAACSSSPSNPELPPPVDPESLSSSTVAVGARSSLLALAPSVPLVRLGPSALLYSPRAEPSGRETRRAGGGSGVLRRYLRSDPVLDRPGAQPDVDGCRTGGSPVNRRPAPQHADDRHAPRRHRLGRARRQARAPVGPFRIDRHVLAGEPRERDGRDGPSVRGAPVHRGRGPRGRARRGDHARERDHAEGDARVRDDAGRGRGHLRRRRGGVRGGRLRLADRLRRRRPDGDRPAAASDRRAGIGPVRAGAERGPPARALHAALRGSRAGHSVRGHHFRRRSHLVRRGRPHHVLAGVRPCHGDAAGAERRARRHVHVRRPGARGLRERLAVAVGAQPPAGAALVPHAHGHQRRDLLRTRSRSRCRPSTRFASGSGSPPGTGPCS